MEQATIAKNAIANCGFEMSLQGRLVLKLKGEDEKQPAVKRLCPFIHTCTGLLSEYDFDTLCLDKRQAARKCINYAYLSKNKMLQAAWSRKLRKELGNLEMHAAKDWVKQYLL